jgi:3-phosphoshikimate 1-carboxyvinyltransferase
MTLIKPAFLEGTMKAPGSKSHFQRVAILSTFNTASELQIENVCYCDDNKAAIQLLEQRGYTVTKGETSLHIQQGDPQPLHDVHIGESGLLARMMLAILALDNRPHRVHGHGTVLQRDFNFLVDALQELGVSVKSNGKLPITLQGPLRAGAYTLDGSKSSQFISGLLCACTQIAGTTELKINDLVSRPYIDLTIHTLNQFSAQIEERENTFIIHGQQQLSASNIEIEGDWSGASCFIVAALLAGNLRIQGLNEYSTQADKSILTLLQDIGIQYTFENSTLAIAQQEYKGFTINATHFPDLIPILVVMALRAQSASKILGIERLMNKESNRAQALITEFAKLGVKLQTDNNAFIIQPQTIRSGQVNAHSDHRIAMCFAIAALVTDHGITIEGSESVSKSYPGFFHDIQTIGGVIE